MCYTTWIFLFSITALLHLNLSAEGPLPPSPEEALKRLLQGNGRYVNDQLEHPNRCKERRAAITSHQEPFAVILGCSDSRVSPEILFDQGVGDLFVVRVAGNVVGPFELESINYAVSQLHSPLIFVLGHKNCGAVSAVLAGKTGGIESLTTEIKPAIENEKELASAVKANVRRVVKKLQATKPIATLIKEKKLGVVGGYYDLNTGKVELLD